MHDDDYRMDATRRAARHEAGHALALWWAAGRTATPCFHGISIGTELDATGNMGSHVDLTDCMPAGISDIARASVYIAGFVAQEDMLANQSACWEDVRNGMGDGDTADDLASLHELADAGPLGLDVLVRLGFDILVRDRAGFLDAVNLVSARLEIDHTMTFDEFLAIVRS